MKKNLLLTAALVGSMGLGSVAVGQIDYSSPTAEVVLTRSFVTTDPTFNFPDAGNYRYYIAADQSTGTLYAVVDEGVSPFTQGLLSFNIDGATIGDPVVITNDIANSRFDGRAFDFGNGLLVQSNRNSAGDFTVVDTTTGQLSTVLVTDPPGNAFIDVGHLSGDTWFALSGAGFSGGDGGVYVWDQTAGTVAASTQSGGTPVTFSAPQGAKIDSNGDVIVLNAGAGNAAEIFRVENWETPDAAVVTDITPPAVGALTNTVWRNLLLTPNDDIIISGRGGGVFVFHIWDGNTVTTIDENDLADAALLDQTFDDVPDNVGIAVHQTASGDLRIILGAREVAGDIQIASLLFPAIITSVPGWENF